MQILFQLVGNSVRVSESFIQIAVVLIYSFVTNFNFLIHIYFVDFIFSL
ncbi:MAG: hypothetical protein RLZZ46_28, partial [Bacteroidota bacterium]